VCEI
jgi:hypothetical protein